ncbi:hypothetical protein KI387_012270, partial [Taxus chinensis]
MVFSIICMVSAALIEIKRIHIAKSHGLLDRPKTTIPLSIFWLAPQFVLIGTANVFTLVGLQEFFYDQVPDSMRSLGISFFQSTDSRRLGICNVDRELWKMQRKAANYMFNTKSLRIFVIETVQRDIRDHLVPLLSNVYNG